MSHTARLLISCPDARGVVASVTSFIHDRGGNIVDLDQHVDPDSNAFFMRVEVERGTLDIGPGEFDESFAPVRERFLLNARCEWCDRPKRVAIFVSQEDHCLADLLWRFGRGELGGEAGGEVVGVISNHEVCRAQVEAGGLAFHHLPVTPETKAEQERTAMALLGELDVDLVILARYMQVLTPRFVAAYPSRIINIHHSFLPAFAGARPYHRAHERGVKLIGATSHYVTDELDEGPIIAQRTAGVTHRDAVADLVRKGRDLERLVLAEAARVHLDDRVLTLGRRTVVFG
ncbi:MAG: formyltetrahydrofolate deformylase [Planctomycetota bacterium]